MLIEGCKTCTRVLEISCQVILILRLETLSIERVSSSCFEDVKEITDYQLRLHLHSESNRNSGCGHSSSLLCTSKDVYLHAFIQLFRHGVGTRSSILP